MSEKTFLDLPESTHFAVPNGLDLGGLDGSFGEDSGDGLVEPVEARGSNSSFFRPI